jgi:hypothetical protein
VHHGIRVDTRLIAFGKHLYMSKPDAKPPLDIILLTAPSVSPSNESLRGRGKTGEDDGNWPIKVIWEFIFYVKCPTWARPRAVILQLPGSGSGGAARNRLESVRPY